MDAKARVMVVEDDYFVALDTSDLLADAGFEVVAIVGSGEQALSNAETLRPDVTLMDITIAGELDGIEAAMKLQQMGLSVIFATAHSDPATIARGEKASPLGWLSKPFDQHAMLRIMTDAVAPGRQNSLPE